MRKVDEIVGKSLPLIMEECGECSVWMTNFDVFLSEHAQVIKIDVDEHLKEWLDVLDIGYQWLTYLFISLHAEIGFSEPKDRVNVPMALIGTGCTQVLAVRNLVVNGLDSAARVMMRCLWETLLTCLKLEMKPELKPEYVKVGEDGRGSAKFWREHLSSSQLGLNLVDSLQGLGATRDVVDDAREWFQDRYRLYSKVVHPTYATAVITSMPPVLKKDGVTLEPGILGVGCRSSWSTVSDCARLMWLFSRLTFPYLVDVLNINRPRSKENTDFRRAVFVGYKLLNNVVLGMWDTDPPFEPINTDKN